MAKEPHAAAAMMLWSTQNTVADLVTFHKSGTKGGWAPLHSPVLKIEWCATVMYWSESYQRKSPCSST